MRFIVAIAIALLVLHISVSFIYFIYSTKEYFEDTGTGSLGFIITRHVNSESTNKLWITCVRQIKKFYPDTTIVIIDDNSNYDFIDTRNVDLNNCILIDSEYKKRGEFLPYYYFYYNKWFDKAIFIHDSVFINNRIKTADTIKDVKFLWHQEGGHAPQEENVERLLSALTHKNELISLFRDLNKWNACWGTMSVIDYDFLKKITDKYNMTELVNHIEGRADRCAVEQAFAIICINEKPELMNDPSIFGHYKYSRNNRNSENYNDDDYEEDVRNGVMTADINKLFFGR